ncbi:MAG: hypothetical protein GY913_34505 [Proteobacteria bacterium]|nr:hypothetical protein [Pseudomonadota bacterium]MCP4922042.1 hypothetical protein [Pseudomonadota bacterium]
MRRSWIALALGSLVGCSSAGKASYDYDTGYGWGDSGGGAADLWDEDTGADWEPEDENAFFALAPAPSPTFVFVANPSRDTVTRIGVPDLDVLTAPVGSQPDQVVTTPDYVSAVVFNKGSSDVSVMDAVSLSERRVDVRPHLDTLELSPDGSWAVLYNQLGNEDEDATGSAVSLKEASFVRLADASHQAMALGFQPRDALFTADGSQAIFLGDTWLGVVDLTAEALDIELIQVADDPLDPPSSEELLLAPDGAFGILRQLGQSELLLVDLATFETERIDVGQGPTDLDLTPDGTHAVAVARADNTLWIYDLSDPTADARVLDLPADELIGSVVFSQTGNQAVLYSTASPYAHYTSWDLSDDTFSVHPLPKPVAGVGIDPTGGTALILHDDEDFGQFEPEYEGKHGLTLVELATHRANDYVLPGEPIGYDQSDDGNKSYLVMEGVDVLEVLDHAELILDEVPLKSDPVFLGTLPELGWAYVSQEHELGRISFYDPAEDSLKTLTGFELNAGIEEEE